MNSSAISLKSLKAETIPQLLQAPSLENSPKHAHLELSILVEHVAKIPRVDYLSKDELAISHVHATQIAQLVQQRIAGVPSSYLVGQREFYSRNFMLTPSVLVPRPETELLVEVCLSIIDSISLAVCHIEQDKRASSLTNITDTRLLTVGHSIVDCGTGSGCIGLTLVEELTIQNNLADWRFCLTDISKESLTCTKQNAELIINKPRLKGLQKRQTLQFLHTNMLEGVNAYLDNIGIIVANLPYIATKDMNAHALKNLSHEPRLALEGVINQENAADTLALAQDKYSDGTPLIELLFEQASTISNSHVIILEIDPLQVDRVARLASDFGYAYFAIHRDYRGKPRVISCIKYII